MHRLTVTRDFQMVLVILIVIFHSLLIGKITIYWSQHKVPHNRKLLKLLCFKTLIWTLYNMMMMISWMYLIRLSTIGNLVVTVSLENVFLDFILIRRLGYS